MKSTGFDHGMSYQLASSSTRTFSDVQDTSSADPTGTSASMTAVPSDCSGQGIHAGGLALIYHENLKIMPVPVTEPSSFEVLAAQLNGPTPTIIVTIYRPPKPSAIFISELTSLLADICAMSPNVILTGDFNIHLDKPTETSAKDFISTLNSFDLVN